MEGWLAATLVSGGWGPLPTPPGSPPQYLEVQVQNPHLVHKEDPVADLPDKHHGVHLSQLVVLVHNPLEELAALDAVCTDPSAGLLQGPLPPPQGPTPLTALTTP